MESYLTAGLAQQSFGKVVGTVTRTVYLSKLRDQHPDVAYVQPLDVNGFRLHVAWGDGFPHMRAGLCTK